MTKHHNSSELWGNTTNPAQHNPAHFRYLVHMDRGISRFSMGSGHLVERNPELEGVRYLDRPADLKKAAHLSTHLIDENHRGTFGGRLGLILDVPACGILLTAPHDIYADSVEHLAWASAKYPELLEPDVLLCRTESYNEVLCSAEAASISGLLCLVGGWRYREADLNMDYVQEKAAELSVPIVELEPTVLPA
jgi:hypothetical protein